MAGYTLPIFTMDEEFFKKLLSKRMELDLPTTKRLIKYYSNMKKLVLEVLEKNTIVYDIPIISKEEFEKHPLCLSLSSSFYAKTIVYTYEEYIEHLEQTRRFAEEHESISIIENKKPAFRNLQIMISPKKFIIVSKSTSPAIHFVIHHPKMVYAIEHMMTPVVETDLS